MNATSDERTGLSAETLDKFQALGKLALELAKTGDVATRQKVYDMTRELEDSLPEGTQKRSVVNLRKFVLES